MCGGEVGDEFPVGVAAVKERHEVAVDPPAQQRVEGLGNEQHFPVADQMEVEVRGEDRQLDEAAVGGRGSLQQPAPGVPV